jgi:hypothetical protein
VVTSTLDVGGGGGVVCAFTVSWSDAALLSVPEVPENWRAAVPAAAEEAAVRLTVSGVPGVTLSVEGEAVTPAGNPVSATAIIPEKPPVAVAVSVTGCALPPAVTLRLVALRESEKAAVAPPPPPLPLPPPEDEATLLPQPQQTPASAPMNAQISADFLDRRRLPGIHMQVI